MPPFLRRNLRMTRRGGRSSYRRRRTRLGLRSRTRWRRGLRSGFIRMNRAARNPLFRAPRSLPQPNFRLVKHKLALSVTLPGTVNEGGIDTRGHGRAVIFRCDNPVQPYALRDPQNTRLRQPRYFDEFQKQYKRCAVVSSRIKVTPDPDQDQSHVFGLFRTHNLTPADAGFLEVAGYQYVDFPTPDLVREQFSVSKPQLLQTRSDALVLKKAYSATKQYGTGLKDVLENAKDSRENSSKGTPEARSTYFMLYAHSLDPTANVNIIKCQVTITYMIAWMDPRDVTLSTYTFDGEGGFDTDLDNNIDISDATTIPPPEEPGGGGP